MSDADREKWNTRYREGSYAARVHPTALLAEWLPRLPRGRALDVACGAGRNALWIAEAGWEVDAIDISSAALERAAATAAKRSLEVRWIEADLEAAPLPDGTYDLIVVVRYVNPDLMPRLIRLLREGGHLLCEQHLHTACEVVGPADPAFRLDAGELLGLVANLRVLWYREGLVEDPDGRMAALAQIVACRSHPGSELAPGRPLRPSPDFLAP